MQPEQSAPEMAAAAAAAAVVREAAASAVMDVLDAGESEEEKNTKLRMAKEDKMRKVIRRVTCASADGVCAFHMTLTAENTANRACASLETCIVCLPATSCVLNSLEFVNVLHKQRLSSEYHQLPQYNAAAVLAAQVGFVHGKVH